MSVRSCRVTIQDLDGVAHTVEVTAESLYEAVVQGLAALRRSEWVAGFQQGRVANDQQAGAEGSRCYCGVVRTQLPLRVRGGNGPDLLEALSLQHIQPVSECTYGATIGCDQ